MGQLLAIPESIAWLMKDASQFTLTVPARPIKHSHQQMDAPPQRGCRDPHLQLRLEVDNADEALKPGMNAWSATQHRQRTDAAHPVTALIDTGNEQRVITVDATGASCRNALPFSRHRKASRVTLWSGGR